MSGFSQTDTSLFLTWFAEKRRFSFLIARKTCPLTFHERLVYSYIVYRTSHGGTTIREIAKATRLHASHTVPKAKRNLVARLLVKEEAGKLLALEPPDPTWFVWKKTNTTTHWYQRLVGFQVCTPPKGWTAKQAVIYFCLFTSNVQRGRKVLPHQKKAGIAAMLGVDHETVQRTWKKLEALNLLEYDYLRKPSNEFLALFPDKPKKKEKHWLASLACGWAFEKVKEGPALARMIDDAAATLLKKGYTHAEVLGYLEQMREKADSSTSVMVEFFWGWQTLFKEVEDRTERQRIEGKFAGRNSLGLLKIETAERIKTIIFEKRYYEQVG